MSKQNLKAMFERADAIDMREGLLAYQRYHQVMSDISLKFGSPIELVIAAFVALSPNNDYVSNLRSLVSVVTGIKNGLPLKDIKVSTYKHCRDRAFSYLKGEVDFISQVKGPKIINFYHNVLRPDDNRWVTVDGHICAAWRGKNLTMKEAIVRNKREYDNIAGAIKQLAFEQFMLPNQYQAVLWFTRKRIFNIKAKLQLGLFSPADDVWNTYHDINELRPFT